MTLEEYTQAVFDYMVKKLPDVNQATICEIAEFFAMKSNNFAYDMIAKHNEQWFKYMRKNDDFYIELIKRYK